MSSLELLLTTVLTAGGILAGSAFWNPSGLPSVPRTKNVRNWPTSRRLDEFGIRDGDKPGRTTGVGAARNHRTRLFESIRDNREKIGRAMSRLRDATRSGDDELAERLKAFIMHLRSKDPQFATQDAMDEALEQGLFSKAAKLKLKLADIKQNPFRQGLLDGVGTADGSSGDVSEDMSWGFDRTFFGEEGEGKDRGDEPEDYYEI